MSYRTSAEVLCRICGRPCTHERSRAEGVCGLHDPKGMDREDIATRRLLESLEASP